MEIISLNIDKVKFVSLNSNREVAKKRLIDNIKANGIGVPPIVVKASDFSDESLRLHFLETGLPVAEIEESYYIIIDGQHRLSALQSLHLKYGDEFSTVEVVLYNKDNLHGKTLPEFIANINSSGKRWTRGDYIHMAASEMPDDFTAKILKKLNLAGFSASSISRYLAFDNKAINEASLINFMNDGVPSIKFVNCGRGLQILNLLFKLGFSYKIIKKRYIIDFIIRADRYGRFDTCIRMLSHLTQKQVHHIESMSGEEIDSYLGKVLTHFSQEDNNVDTDETASSDEILLETENENGVDIPSNDAKQGLQVFVTFMTSNDTVPKNFKNALIEDENREKSKMLF